MLPVLFHVAPLPFSLNLTILGYAGPLHPFWLLFHCFSSLRRLKGAPGLHSQKHRYFSMVVEMYESLCESHNNIFALLICGFIKVSVPLEKIKWRIINKKFFVLTF
jgi:hypothetical protein